MFGNFLCRREDVKGCSYGMLGRVPWCYGMRGRFHALVAEFLVHSLIVEQQALWSAAEGDRDNKSACFGRGGCRW